LWAGERDLDRQRAGLASPRTAYDFAFFRCTRRPDPTPSPEEAGAAGGERDRPGGEAPEDRTAKDFALRNMAAQLPLEGDTVIVSITLPSSVSPTAVEPELVAAGTSVVGASTAPSKSLPGVDCPLFVGEYALRREKDIDLTGPIRSPRAVGFVGDTSASWGET
jgi:hypothetical protein